MKRAYKVLLITALLNGMLFSCGNKKDNTLGDNEVVIDGIRYVLQDDYTARINGYMKNTYVSKSIINKIKVKKDNKEIEYRVTGINSYSFCDCESYFGDFVIEDGIENVEEAAFYHCIGLWKLTLPSSIKTIERSAFSNCYGLREIHFSEGLTTIGSSAFNSCGFVEEINIPKSVKNISLRSFENTDIGKLKYDGSISDWMEIEFDDTDSHFETVQNVYFNEEEPVKDLVIPEGITKINNYCFDGFGEINSVSIPNSVTSIGKGAFYNCYNLLELNIPESVKEIGEKAFSKCDGLKEVNLLNGIQTINNHAFSYCKFLESITLPESVTTIGTYAFENCSKLNSVTISSTQVKLEANVFANSKNLNKIVFNGTIEEWNSLNKSSKWNDGSNISIIECSDGNIEIH